MTMKPLASLVILSLIQFLLNGHFLRAQVALDSAINFTVKDTRGVTHKLYDYLNEGKMVVLDFFMVTCGPCATYAPQISDSYLQFGCNGGNVIFLGINYGSDNQAVNLFGENYSVKYPEASGLEGNGNAVTELYSPQAFPTVILILPDRSIPEPFIWPPTTFRIDSIVNLYGGQPFNCNTSAGSNYPKDEPLSIFPNPCTSGIRIRLEIMADEVQITLQNPAGIIMKNIMPENRLPIDEYVSLHDLPAGLYLLTLTSHGRMIGQRKIVKR